MLTVCPLSAVAVFEHFRDASQELDKVLEEGLWEHVIFRKEVACEVFCIFYAGCEIEAEEKVGGAWLTVLALLVQRQMQIARRRIRGSKILSLYALIEFMDALNKLLGVLGEVKPQDDSGSDGRPEDSASHPDDQGKQLTEVAAKMSEKIKNFGKTVETVQKLFPGADWDLSKGKLTRINPEDIEKLEELAQNLRWFQDLVAVLGKLGSLSRDRSRRWDPDSFSRGEMHSLTRGAEISRIIPSELRLMHHRITRMLFFARFLERSLLVYETRSRLSRGDTQKGGPVIVMVDTSGSMKGDEELIAKAFVLALAHAVLKESRDLLVGLFGSSNEYIEYKLVGRRVELNEFLSFLTQGFGGGTDFNVPLIKSAERIRETQWNFADCIFLTDGMGLPSPRSLSLIAEVKREFKTKVYALIINQEKPGGMEKIADQVFYTSSFDLTGTSELIHEI